MNHPGHPPGRRGPAWNCAEANWRFDCCGTRHYIAAVSTTTTCDVCGDEITRPAMSTSTCAPIGPHEPWTDARPPATGPQIGLFG